MWINTYQQLEELSAQLKEQEKQIAHLEDRCSFLQAELITAKEKATARVTGGELVFLVLLYAIGAFCAGAGMVYRGWL